MTVLALTTVASAGLGIPPAVAATSPTATILGGAVSGGNVIVKLADQHVGGQLSALSGGRKAAVDADQTPLVARMTAAGATHIHGLIGVNAIAANVSADEVTQLSQDPEVQEIVPDIAASATAPAPHGTPAKLNPELCRSNQNQPALEPEALSALHVATDAKNDPDQAALVATGKNVTVGIVGVDSLVGNPNFIRAGGSPVVRDSPRSNPVTNDGEIYGDASAVAAQGSVTYGYATEPLHSALPAGCTFRVKGGAPDASLVDTLNLPGYGAAGGPTSITLSEILAGIDNAVLNGHANVISESYTLPDVQIGGLLEAANDAAVAAGVTVLAAADDQGAGLDDPAASDPNVIGVGTTDSLRVLSGAYGYGGWTDNNIAPFSASGAAQNDKLVDVVAPGYSGSVAAPPALDGTSQSTPLAAGVAADVIQAYADSHGGRKPTPAMVKQILVGTAQDLGAPAEQQGSGLINAYAAVRAAQQEPNGRSAPESDSASLIPSQTQLDVTGAGGSQSTQNVGVYNTGNAPAQVTGTLRSLGDATQIGSTVTEPVSAPASGPAVPAQGATAATPIQFTVPAGLDRLDADMIWPDPTNSSILSFTLVDPQGKLTQISADYGSGAAHKVSDSQHAEVTHPAPGTWTAKILWASGRAALQDPPNVPGAYAGSLSFKVSGQQFVTTAAGNAITVPAHGSATIPVPVSLPADPGDHPQSLQLAAANTRTLSIPIARRTLIPSAGGAFSAQITGSVGFPGAVGEVHSFDIDVPAGSRSLDVSLTTPDASTNNIIRYLLVDPQGNLQNQDATPTTTVQSFGPGTPVGRASLTAQNPVAGRWKLNVFLAQTVSGKEFTQTVTGSVGYDQIQPTGGKPVGTGGCANIQAPTRAAVTAIAFACDQIGLPYQWGGNGPANGDAGFDCSGLTTAAYRAAGISLPRTAQTQYNAGPLVPVGQPLLAGDLVFYGTVGHVHHVALYLGAGMMVQAPDFGRPIQISPYRWTGDDYLGASRPASQ
jgi:cell wall-associated NlpC family hydrolase